MKINMNYLIDQINYNAGCDYEYYRLGRNFYKKHGYGVDLDHPNTPEKKAVAYACRLHDRSGAELIACFELLDIHGEERSRAYSAARAMRRWYNDTRYERSAPETLLIRIGKYIEGV